MTVDCAGKVKWFLKWHINRTQTTFNFHWFFVSLGSLSWWHCTVHQHHRIIQMCAKISYSCIPFMHSIHAFQIPLPLYALSQEVDLSKLLIIDGQWTQSAPWVCGIHVKNGCHIYKIYLMQVTLLFKMKNPLYFNHI